MSGSADSVVPPTGDQQPAPRRKRVRRIRLRVLLDALDRWLDGFDTRLVSGRRARTMLTIGTLMVLVGATSISALDGLLREMHAAGDVAAGVRSGLYRWPDGIAAVVQGWHNFADTDILGRYLSAPVLVWASLAVDSLVLVPGYLLAGSVLLLLGARWNADPETTRRAARRRARHLTWQGRSVSVEQQAINDAAMFRVRLRAAFYALVGLALVDLVENALSALVVWRLWPSTPGMVVDLTAVDTVLAVVLVLVTTTKWLLAAWVIVELLLLAGRYLMQPVEPPRAARAAAPPPTADRPGGGARQHEP
jgi:hypothetical protein